MSWGPTFLWDTIRRVLFCFMWTTAAFKPFCPNSAYPLYIKQATTLLSPLQAGKHTNWGWHIHKPAGVRALVHARTHTVIVIVFLWQAARGRKSHIKIPLQHSASLLQCQPPPGRLSAPMIPRLSSSSRKEEINLALVISACVKTGTIHR